MGDDAERMRALAKEVIKHCDLSIPTLLQSAIIGQGSRGPIEVPEFFHILLTKKLKFLPLSAAKSCLAGGVSTT